MLFSNKVRAIFSLVLIMLIYSQIILLCKFVKVASTRRPSFDTIPDLFDSVFKLAHRT